MRYQIIKTEQPIFIGNKKKSTIKHGSVVNRAYQVGDNTYTVIMSNDGYDCDTLLVTSDYSLAESYCENIVDEVQEFDLNKEGYYHSYSIQSIDEDGDYIDTVANFYPDYKLFGQDSMYYGGVKYGC